MTIKSADLIHHCVLFLLGHLREDRQAQHLLGSPFGLGQTALTIAQTLEAILLVQRDRVVDLGPDPCLLQVLSQDYIRTAHSKGLRQSVVLYKHGLRNGLLPVVTAAGLQFGRLLGGAFIVESIFSWPGMGKYTLYAISVRDIPVIQATTLVFAVCFVVVTLLVDATYALIDPRIRFD